MLIFSLASGSKMTQEGSGCFKFVIPKGYNNCHSHWQGTSFFRHLWALSCFQQTVIISSLAPCLRGPRSWLAYQGWLSFLIHCRGKPRQPYQRLGGLRLRQAPYHRSAKALRGAALSGRPFNSGANSKNPAAASGAMNAAPELTRSGTLAEIISWMFPHLWPATGALLLRLFTPSTDTPGLSALGGPESSPRTRAS